MERKLLVVPTYRYVVGAEYPYKSRPNVQDVISGRSPSAKGDENEKIEEAG